MKVTEIQSISRQKMRVFLDGEPAFAASPAQIRSFGLEEGLELDETRETRLIRQVSIYAARTAAELLGVREYSAQDLRQKLLQKEFSPVFADFAVNYCIQKHYQDDLRFAECFIRAHQKKKSRMQLQAQLNGHGISDEVMEEAFRETGFDEMDGLVLTIRKKTGSGSIPEPGDPTREKLLQSLLRRGYRCSDILHAFEELS